MRLYLSSFRMGDHPEYLIAMAGGPVRAAVIANAMDDAPAEIRREAVKREVAALGELGVSAAEFDLRDYFGACDLLRSDLDGYGLVWLRGGNVFMLRYALARSGGDDVLRGLLASDALVYAGYSAGACVLAPSLRGLETVDDPVAVTRIYGEDPVWEGLGVLDHAVVPHVRSPAHPESAAAELVAERYQALGIPYRALRDGQALVIQDGRAAIV